VREGGEDSRLSLTAAAKAGAENKPVLAALKSVRENVRRHSGTGVVIPLYPALKRGAKLGRAFGAGFSEISFHLG